MIDLNITFVIQLINFLIILFVLNFLLYRPIRGIIKKRTDLMAQQLTDIEQFSSQAQNKVDDYKAALEEARKEGKEIRGKYREEGYTVEKELLESAGQEAASKLKTAREEITSNQKKALSELESRVDQYAQKATDKILGQA